MKKRFFVKCFSEDSKYSSVLMTKREYDSIIEYVKVSKKKESSQDYRIIQRYDVLIVQGCEKFIEPLSCAKKCGKVCSCGRIVYHIVFYSFVNWSLWKRQNDQAIKYT